MDQATVPSPGSLPEGEQHAVEIDGTLAALVGTQTPLLFCHRSPDGDTVGAAVALARALRQRGASPTIVCADPLPLSARFIPDSATITATLPSAVDLLVTIDCSDPGMLGALRTDLERLRSGYPLLNIDHHASDTEYGDINLVDTTAASTAEIVYDLIERLGVPIDRSMAIALLTGIVNDTHSFQNANTSPRALATAARLVALGADPALITYHLLLRRRPQAALLWARTLATMRLDGGGRVASAYMTQQMLRECDAEATDLDGMVEFLRNIDGVDLAFVLKATDENNFKASLRTTERVDAVEMTAPFGGGGHRRAAGCDLVGSPSEARAAILARYRELTGAPADPEPPLETPSP